MDKHKLKITIGIEVEATSKSAAKYYAERRARIFQEDHSIDVEDVKAFKVGDIRVGEVKPRKIDPNACESTDKSAKG